MKEIVCTAFLLLDVLRALLSYLSYSTFQVVMKKMFNEKTNTMSVVDANDHKTDFLLRGNRDVLNTTDPDGFVYQNIYDDNDRIIKFIYPDGESELSDYDDLGRLVKFTGRAGKEVKFEYDEKDRIVSLH